MVIYCYLVLANAHTNKHVTESNTVENDTKKYNRESVIPDMLSRRAYSKRMDIYNEHFLSLRTEISGSVF